MLKNESERIFVLPAIITYSNLFLGILAIMFANSNDLESLKLASILLILAAISDKLDGYVARKLNMTSEFGKQLDSLSDIISFGIAPIIISLNFGLINMSIISIFISLIYVGCGVFRLARFNILENDMYIYGLPITISGLIIAIKHIVDIVFRIEIVNKQILLNENIFLIVILSLLMTSNFKIKKPF